MKTIIIDVNSKNIQDYPVTCFMKKDNPGYVLKEKWLKKRFSEGMKIKLLYLEGDKTCHGFIEYLPSEYAWRSVDAKKYSFIHCIWTYPNKVKKKGYGKALINECLNDAKEQKKNGVAVITSDGPFMASKDLFLKSGFKLVEEDGQHQLLVKELKKGAKPKLTNHSKELLKYKGFNIVYSKQCPWANRFVEDLDKKTINKYKIKIKELKTAKQAQKAPSIYSVFNLIVDGKLLADHYISARRFDNILKKEL